MKWLALCPWHTRVHGHAWKFSVMGGGLKQTGGLASWYVTLMKAWVLSPALCCIYKMRAVAFSQVSDRGLHRWLACDLPGPIGEQRQQGGWWQLSRLLVNSDLSSSAGTAALGEHQGGFAVIPSCLLFSRKENIKNRMKICMIQYQSYCKEV